MFFLGLQSVKRIPFGNEKTETKGKWGLGCISANLVLLHACWRSTNKSVSTDPAAKPKWSQSKAHCHGTKRQSKHCHTCHLNLMPVWWKRNQNTWEIQRNMVLPGFSFCSSCFTKEPGNLWRQCDGSQTFQHFSLLRVAKPQRRFGLIFRTKGEPALYMLMCCFSHSGKCEFNA